MRALDPSGAFRPWPADEVRWGETVCEAPGCFRPAEVLWDVDERGRGRGIPVCVDDADLLVEAWAARVLGGSRVSELPDPWELRRPLARHRPPPEKE